MVLAFLQKIVSMLPCVWRMHFTTFLCTCIIKMSQLEYAQIARSGPKYKIRDIEGFSAVHYYSRICKRLVPSIRKGLQGESFLDPEHKLNGGMIRSHNLFLFVRSITRAAQAHCLYSFANCLIKRQLIRQFQL